MSKMFLFKFLVALSRAMAPSTELGSPKGDGDADWDLEAFFTALQDEGLLDSMRSAALDPRKKKGQHAVGQDDTSVSEAEDWDRWTSSNTEDGASTSCTESDLERDMDGQQTCNKPAVGRWGFQTFVGGGTAPATGGRVGKSPSDAMSDSCDSLPHLDGEGNLISMIGSDSADGLRSCRGLEEEIAGGIEETELDEFLAELDQNENTEASAAAGWRLVMHRSNSTLQCTSWLRDPGSRGGSEYRGRMIVQGVSPESARDFLLDEAHRTDWDENRVLSEQLEDWDENGCTVVRWVRRLPFFLRNREYVVARRVWNPSDRTFYCISRHTSHSSAPLHPNLVRVSSFYSSWQIRPVKPGCPDGTPLEPNALPDPSGLVAVEIVTHHEEESGLQKDIARMGVAHGMWAHLQKMGQELHAYAESGKNAKHILPVFLIQADARLGLLSPPKPSEQRLLREQIEADLRKKEQEQELSKAPLEAAAGISAEQELSGTTVDVDASAGA